jgi:hypothetical protein
MSGAYVYLRSEQYLYTVGFYTPDGSWVPETDHSTLGAAAARVHYLNGGNGTEWDMPKQVVRVETGPTCIGDPK